MARPLVGKDLEVAFLDIIYRANEFSWVECLKRVDDLGVELTSPLFGERRRAMTIVYPAFPVTSTCLFAGVWRRSCGVGSPPAYLRPHVWNPVFKINGNENIACL